MSQEFETTAACSINFNENVVCIVCNQEMPVSTLEHKCESLHYTCYICVKSANENELK